MGERLPRTADSPSLFESQRISRSHRGTTGFMQFKATMNTPLALYTLNVLTDIYLLMFASAGDSNGDLRAMHSNGDLHASPINHIDLCCSLIEIHTEAFIRCKRLSLPCY